MSPLFEARAGFAQCVGSADDIERFAAEHGGMNNLNHLVEIENMALVRAEHDTFESIIKSVLKS